MGKWLLVAMALATVGAALVLWRSLAEPADVSTFQSPPDAAPTEKRDPVRPGPNTLQGRKAVKGPSAEDITDSIDKAELRRKPTEKEIEIEAIGRFRSGPVVQELYGRAASCYRGEDGRSEKMTVRYHLKVEAGQASIENATLLSSELNNSRLEDCIIRALLHHSWPVADGFELDEPNEQASFSLLGLQKRAEAREQQASED